jgi:hypothetical protein
MKERTEIKTLQSVPNEREELLVEKIGSYMQTKDRAYVASTNKYYNRLFKQELNNEAAEKLLTYAVRAQQDDAEKMIKANPSLLSISASVKDNSGRTIIATPFQAALGVGDKPMWEMMLQYLDKGEALKQFKEQFPKGVKDDVSAQELKPYYNAIASAISNNQDNGLSAIEAFRVDLTSQKEIKQGKHFNLQHLVAAYQVFIDHFRTFQNLEQRNLFWQKVIGYVQSQMTAYDAQVHCSGIERVLSNNSEFSRTLTFCNGGNFFPLSGDSGLGFDFAAARSGYTGKWMSKRSSWGGRVSIYPTKRFIEKKLESLANLKESLEQGLCYQPN